MFKKNLEKISVLGAGWLGWPLALQLQRQDYILKTSTTTPEKLELLQADGLNPCLLKIDHGLVEVDDPSFFDTDLIILNIPPSRRRPDVALWYPNQVRAILEYAAQMGVPKILFIGSTSVYGEANEVLNENSILQPETGAGKALVQAEQLVKNVYPGDASSILRMAGLIGGERKAGRFFAGKKDLPEGNAPVNLVHQQDCIGVIERVIRQGAWGKIYNVCADEHPRKADFYTAQAILEGLVPPEFLPDETPRHRVVSNRLVKEELGYVFKVKMKNEK